jgi:hypothetical protein
MIIFREGKGILREKLILSWIRVSDGEILWFE